ncbi:MAG: hypothetical protein U0572_13350 [Phycisphaerales bacterium]
MRIEVANRGLADISLSVALVGSLGQGIYPPLRLAPGERGVATVWMHAHRVAGEEMHRTIALRFDNDSQRYVSYKVRARVIACPD